MNVDECSILSVTSTLGSSPGRRDGLETGAVGVRVLHAGGPAERSPPGRIGRGGGVATPERRVVGQDATVVTASRKLHLSGSGPRALDRSGLGPRLLVDVARSGRIAAIPGLGFSL